MRFFFTKIFPFIFLYFFLSFFSLFTFSCNCLKHALNSVLSDFLLFFKSCLIFLTCWDKSQEFLTLTLNFDCLSRLYYKTFSFYIFFQSLYFFKTYYIQNQTYFLFLILIIPFYPILSGEKNFIISCSTFFYALFILNQVLTFAL